MASTAAGNEASAMEGLSPTDTTPMAQPPPIAAPLGSISGGLSAIESRADPDAQTTITDFLDFTDYLPSDMIRSLTLIGNLDQTYTNASTMVDALTSTWGRLPNLPPDERPSPVQLRADISEHLEQAVDSRVFAHAEAVRMSENVTRHYHKAKALLAKLKTMMENYPTEEAKSPVTTKSPQLARSKIKGEGMRRQPGPRITVPGEVSAPYDFDYDTLTDESDVSSDEDSDTPGASYRTPATAPRIKIVSSKPPKTPSRAARPVQYPTAALSAAAAANAAALLNPPPENAVIGSPDAPWLQLTHYELAKLRKRMKKNATWTPSETMIARELKALGRGPDAFKEAKKKAEEEGKVFEPTVPAPVVDDESGTKQLPAGAISVDTLAAEDVPTSNRGMKLNEAKKLKREALAKQAAEEAEESWRKMSEQAKLIINGPQQSANTSPNANANANANANSSASANTNTNPTPTPNAESPKDNASKVNKTRTTTRVQAKRKREAEGEGSNGVDEEADPQTSRPPLKRTKTETPVPPPQHPAMTRSKVPTPEHSNSTPNPLPTPTPGGSAAITHAETPVPIPIPPQSSSKASSVKVATSPVPSITSHENHTVTTSIPVKLPPTETPVPLPIPEQRKSVTPVLPPIIEAPVRETTKRETRGEAAKRNQQHHPPQKQPTPVPPPQPLQSIAASEPIIKQSSSRAPTPRAPTPRTTPGPERRPGSRGGKAMSQEPQPSLAADRPRRASTARNTPAPEPRPPSKRTKRPVPGVVSVTSSGGNTAASKRKAAPRKKVRVKKEKGQVEDEDVDEFGEPIDPDEPRYCLCNSVSYGTMIQCENNECKQEWFHLECVGLTEIPARTTKWYCPDCRRALNIGEKGEVSARGVRA